MKSLYGAIQEAFNPVDESLADVEPKAGKMHKVLGIDADKKIEDVYKDGDKLAQALYDKLKDKKEVTGMLAFAANINKEVDIFDKALKAIKDVKESVNEARDAIGTFKHDWDADGKHYKKGQEFKIHIQDANPNSSFRLISVYDKKTGKFIGYVEAERPEKMFDIKESVNEDTSAENDNRFQVFLSKLSKLTAKDIKELTGLEIEIVDKSNFDTSWYHSYANKNGKTSIAELHNWYVRNSKKTNKVLENIDENKSEFSNFVSEAFVVNNHTLLAGTDLYFGKKVKIDTMNEGFVDATFVRIDEKSAPNDVDNFVFKLESGVEKRLIESELSKFTK